MIDQEKVKKAVRLLLEGIGEDADREGLIETPDRIARMCEEIYGGYEEDAKEHLCKTFHVENSDMVVEKDITFYSMCEHHLLPFYGKAHIRIFRTEKLRGLASGENGRGVCKKASASRTAYGSDRRALMNELKAKGAAVVIEAEHMCMTMRGIKKPGSRTVTFAKRGLFETDPALEERFFRMLERG